MILKPPLSIDDQVSRLEKRGMIINDPDTAKKFLSENNYYRINIYFHKFMDSNNHFNEGTEISYVIGVYYNDRWLRNLIFNLLEPIEIKLKTQIAYYLSIEYGSDCFYKDNIYKDLEIQKNINHNFKNEISRNRRDPVVYHHKNAYGGFFPIWVIVDYLSFNSISKYYGNLLVKDKKLIAKNAFNINENYLEKWIHTLSVMRNICGHYGYIFRRKYSVKPPLIKEFGWNRNDNSNLFAICLVIRKLTDKQSWTKFIQELDDRVCNDNSFSLDDYGFPLNWKKFLF